MKGHRRGSKGCCNLFLGEAWARTAVAGSQEAVGWVFSGQRAMTTFLMSIATAEVTAGVWAPISLGSSFSRCLPGE